MDIEGYSCAFCAQEVEQVDWIDALVWVDPCGISCITHGACVAIFDGVAVWPREVS